MSSHTVTQNQIDELLNSSEKESHTFYGKDLVICFKLPNGFTVIGRAACVDPANFDIRVGEEIARKDAANKLWQLLGYQLQDKLFNEGTL